MTDPMGPCETCGLYHDARDGANVADPIRSPTIDRHETTAVAAYAARLRERLEENDALANAIYVGIVNPDLTWWDDLTPEMQEHYRRAARAVLRLIEEKK